MGIVTLPCEIGRGRAVSFDVIGVHGDRVFLVDLSADWNGYASVIEAAREVFRYCHATYGTRRIIRDDPKWDWHEIVHENGAFAVAPYSDGVPFGFYWRGFLAQGRKNIFVGGA